MGGRAVHTPLFCQIIIKSAINWLEYTNKNLWGGESPTSFVFVQLFLLNTIDFRAKNYHIA